MSTIAKKERKTDVIIVAGPAACGKTTIADYLSKSLGFTYIEGDDLHPQANIDKMAQGHALTDEDRWGWLEKIGIVTARTASSEDVHGIVVTCSALKRKYRDRLRSELANKNIVLWFVFLHASKETLTKRIKARVGHFMKAEMITSQLNTLEPPNDSEPDACTINVEGTMTQAQHDCLAQVQKLLDKENQE
ncbi:gluconokinase [Schizosaccharomyces japonicus yFS275]|uniref:Gluconokinase n=1 Tax=Schizosaccharomyces japonicus (strain yFS275 / FY16936) TaxID=402676 RepID=B6JW63_SCHJY|nr:gluconokinase [Schizosaccharomyces japonicus yFS275]EEB05614.1 gluconokinase [Schizosaccharomyces japonicus yFS275]